MLKEWKNKELQKLNHTMWFGYEAKYKMLFTSYTTYMQQFVSFKLKRRQYHHACHHCQDVPHSYSHLAATIIVVLKLKTRRCK